MIWRDAANIPWTMDNMAKETLQNFKVKCAALIRRPWKSDSFKMRTPLQGHLCQDFSKSWITSVRHEIPMNYSLAFQTCKIWKHQWKEQAESKRHWRSRSWLWKSKWKRRDINPLCTIWGTNKLTPTLWVVRSVLLRNQCCTGLEEWLRTLAIAADNCTVQDHLVLIIFWRHYSPDAF